MADDTRSRRHHATSASASVTIAHTEDISNECHIYEASPRDAAVLHSLILELAAFYHATEQARLSVAQLEADLAAGKFWCLLAARSVGEPAVGYALCYSTYSTWEGEGLYIDDLYVREAQRGRQMGTALVHGCVRRALDTGCQRLQWQALDWNARALEFYTRCVGAVERVEASGARYVNLIMRPDAMAAFCDRQAARRGGEQARGATTAGGAAAAPSPVAAPAGSQTLDAV